MEMRRPGYFLAMTRLLDFSRAAEESNVPRRSLTRTIQSVGTEFGVGRALRKHDHARRPHLHGAATVERREKYDRHLL